MPKIKKSKKGIFLPPAVGYSFRVLLNLCYKNHVSLRYYPRLVAITLINLINLPFRIYERWRINPGFDSKRISKPPVFILGHWRSGTTHLHNLLSQDQRFGYVTTYQSVFPDTLHSRLGRFIFGSFTKLLIPGKRKGDNVELNPAFPQEEEFALGDKTPVCFYYFWMFPKKIRDYYEHSIRFNGVQHDLKEKWKKDYLLLIKKALKNTNSDHFLSKNPSNTARIKILIEMFPNAKFIHIHRNPVEVFLSTRNFYFKMLPHLQLQTISQEETENHIIEIYKQLMTDFLEQNKLIPAGNFVEIAFADLEKSPLENLNVVYEKLGLEGFEGAEPYFHHYLGQKEDYEKNSHQIREIQLHKIMDEWGFMMKHYNYSIPEKIEILHE
jgi:hypothetical protein